MSACQGLVESAHSSPRIGKEGDASLYMLTHPDLSKFIAVSGKFAETSVYGKLCLSQVAILIL